MTDKFWDRLFDWLEKYLPGLIAAFTMGLKTGQSGTLKLKAKVIELKLEVKKAVNRNDVEKTNKDKSDLDILNDTISEGRKSERKDS